MRPDVGYCQGMSHIVGNLLLHCGPPQECFKVFCNMQTCSIINDFHSFNYTRIAGTYKVYWKLLLEHCPKMHAKLLESDLISCSIFLLEWMITLFSSTLEISVAAYIWDQVFFFGEMHMMRVAIAISKIVELKTMNGPDIAEVDAQRELKDCSKHVSKPELVKMLMKMKSQIKY